MKRSSFEYHTNLHHSQTVDLAITYLICLSTILIYIILKPFAVDNMYDVV